MNAINLEYLKNNEGELRYFIGKFKHKKNYVAFSTNNLVLNDGTEIILTLSSYNDKDNIFAKANNNKYLKILAKVYVNDIPEKYNIISRTDNPYMVEIQTAEIYKWWVYFKKSNETEKLQNTYLESYHNIQEKVVYQRYEFKFLQGLQVTLNSFFNWNFIQLIRSQTTNFEYKNKWKQLL